MTHSTRLGQSDHFRKRGWLERATERLRGSRRRPMPAVVRRAYEALLETTGSNRLIATLPGGERVRLSARYRHLSWNPDEYRAFRAAVVPGSVVFDVGANVGAYALLFAYWTGPAGRVVAFEPAPDARAGLLRHLRLNRVDDRVNVVAAAASGVTGDGARLFVDAHGGATSLLEAPGASPIRVPAVTLDSFCAARDLWPDVLKIDVEGAELDVLRGSRQVLARPGVHVFVEFHPSTWNAHAISTGSVEQELRSLGFRPEPLDPAFDVWRTEGVCARLVRC